MEGEQAYPACRMDGVLVWMMPRFGDPGGYVVDCDDSVEDRYDHENEQPEREIVQEWIAYLVDHVTPLQSAAKRHSNESNWLRTVPGKAISLFCGSTAHRRASTRVGSLVTSKRRAAA